MSLLSHSLCALLSNSQSDFLLLELKSLLARNKKIKVVLMSATIQQSTFANYYKDPPMLTIPGRTFPVRDFYMEDIIQATDYMPKSAKASRNFTKEEQDTMQRFFIDNNVSDPNHLSTLGMLSRSDQVDFELLAKTVSLVLERLGEAKGAILVFVSGVSAIAGGALFSLITMSIGRRNRSSHYQYPVGCISSARHHSSTCQLAFSRPDESFRAWQTRAQSNHIDSGGRNIVDYRGCRVRCGHRKGQRD